MTDSFGDYSPFSKYSNPLEGAIEHSADRKENVEVERTKKQMSELSKTLIMWGAITAAVVGTCVYVSQQHGERPTLLPQETSQP